MVQLIDTRVFTHESWDTLLAPFFRGTAAPCPGQVEAPVRASRDEWLTNMSDLVVAHPDWELRGVKPSLEFDVKQNLGTVWLQYENVGIPAGTVIDGFAVFEFREGRGGKWRCVRSEGAHGGVVQE